MTVADGIPQASDDISKEGRTGKKAQSGLGPASFGVRRACDECGRQKKKCSGASPCRYVEREIMENAHSPVGY